jgi:hypothetical protein
MMFVEPLPTTPHPTNHFPPHSLPRPIPRIEMPFYYFLYELINKGIHVLVAALSDEVFYKINAVYLGRVTYVDWLFGHLLAGIDVRFVLPTFE